MPINKTGIYKDKKPQYLVRVNYTDSYGKYKQVERTVYGKAEAEAEERKLCFELKDKQVPLISRMTVEQLIIEYDSYHKQTTKKTSHITTMKTLELRVKPFLGNVRLDKLTQSVLLDWQKEIYQQKLAHSTRCNAYSALMGLLNYAQKKEYILKNPLKPLGPFKDVNNGIKKEKKFYTIEEFQKFIKAAKRNCKTVNDWNFYVFFNILFLTGVRKGEAYGLTWNDINGNVLHIRCTVSQKVKDEKHDHTDTTKSNRERDILIPDKLQKIINAHKKRQQAFFGDKFRNDFKICGCGDIAIRDSTVNTHSKKFAEEAGVPYIHPHAFRHSHATLLINNNVNVVDISKRLGHASITETIPVPNSNTKPTQYLPTIVPIL